MTNTLTATTDDRFTDLTTADGTLVAHIWESDGYWRWSRDERRLLPVSGGTAHTFEQALDIVRSMYAAYNG